MSDVSIIALRGFDVNRGRAELTAAFGSTLADMVAQAFPGQPADLWRVTIAGHVIDRAFWRNVRPKPGSVVVIRPAMQGDNLRSILTVVVTVAAVALGQFYLGPLLGSTVLGGASLSGFGGFTLGAGSSALFAGVATGGLLIAGTLLLNAFIPVAQASQSSPGASPTIQGLKNVLNPGAVIPKVMGTHRFAPPYAAIPYTEIVGDDQFVVASFLFGYGPLSITNLRLGDTPIDNFADVQYEVRYGYPGDIDLTLYPKTVIEEAMTVELAAAASTDRVTARNSNECSLDFTFPQGLVEYDDKGNEKSRTVDVTIQYRALGDTDWLLVGVIGFTSNKQDIIRRTYPFRFNSPGQYEIRCTRTTADAINTKQIDKVNWTVIRSHRDQYPINFDTPIALACLRIRASKQLQGIVDNFNADVTSIVPDWDDASGTWITRATNNPASLFRYALQGPEFLFSVPDSQINLPELQDFHDFCVSNNLHYNRVHDFDGSLKTTLDAIAGAGRALAHDEGDKWGVIIDRPRTTIIDHLSPRNSWGFSGERPFVTFPDAFRVQFLDQTNGYISAERIVPWPGLVGDVQVTEDLPLPGITDPNAVWREARKRQYELINRRDTYSISQDVESLVVSRGDLVVLSHDVLNRAQVTARVKSISGNVVTVDEVFDMTAPAGYAARFRLSDGTSYLTTIRGSGTKTSSIYVDNVTGIAVGNLVFLGLVGSESYELIVKGTEGGENLTAVLTLVDHAPQIQALVDAEVPPGWSPLVGEISNASSIPPGIPSVTGFLSGAAAISVGITSSAVILITAGSGLIPPATYEVDHRMVGGGAFTVTTAPAAEGGVRLNGYSTGDHIEFKVRAESIAGYFSDFTTLDSTHYIGETNATLLSPNDLTNAAWTKTNVTATATSAIDPLGGTSASQILETVTNAVHEVSQGVTGVSGATYKLQVALKTSGRTHFILRLGDAGSTNYFQATFDIGAVTTSTPTAGGSGVIATNTITDMGNGWYTCLISGHVPLTALLAQLYVDNGGGTYSYTGDVTKGYFAYDFSIGI